MKKSARSSSLTKDEIVASPTDELMGSQSKRWLADMLARSSLQVSAETSAVVGDALFMDKDFPGACELNAAVKWKRPKEICPSPQFIIDGASRLDICQGKLSDCWFLSAVSSLSLNRRLLERVVPLNQSFQDGYTGSFFFRFWQYGQWEEVKVDDLLPTLEGGLVYLSSHHKQEFWSSLLEKAYAKVKGGYMALEMGFPHEAMVDMTGGVTEVLAVAALPRELPRMLALNLMRGALISCANGQGPLEKQNAQGIMFRHAYSLTGVEQVNTSHGPVDLVRVLNPWGNTEWSGAWSDLNGAEWNTVSVEEQKRLGRVIREDGEFWMAISDFRQNFDIMEVCHLTDSLGQSGVRPWKCTMCHGGWVPGLSAGGAPVGGLFWKNPQYHLNLQVPDDPSDPKKLCSFLLALMQKNQRRSGVSLAIALHVYQARSHGNPLSPQDLSSMQPLLSTTEYTPRREVLLHGHLATGCYVVVASASEPNQAGSFLLRLLAEQGNAVTPAVYPEEQAISTITEPLLLHQSALPSPSSSRTLFKKHCSQGFCRPLELYRLLREAIQGGVLAGSEKMLSLEHCKSLVVVMDSHGLAQLDWQAFENLWAKICRWTDIFLTFDKNKSQRLEYKEVPPALTAAGITVDDFIMQLIGLRYTEPDLTISYPGFLYLLMKLDSMIYKFHAFDMARMGTISIDYRQWLHMTLYN